MTKWLAIRDISFKYNFPFRPLNENIFKPILAFDIQGGSSNSYKNSTLSKLFSSCIMLKMFKSPRESSWFILFICLNNLLIEIEVFRKEIINLKQFCQSTVIKSSDFRVGSQVTVPKPLLVPA